jgi:phosphoribosylglycinamide formyltransferase-1
VGIVVSNVSGAQGLERARKADVPTAVIPHRDYPSREEFDAAVVRRLREHGVDLVCLAGFMRLVSPVLVRAFEGRILNVHPSLLPAFAGLHAQRQALEHGVKVTGATVHLVDEELDHGPILLQRAVPVLEDDDEETLSARILKEEHRLYPEAIALVLDGRVRVEGRRAVIE